MMINTTILLSFTTMLIILLMMNSIMKFKSIKSSKSPFECGFSSSQPKLMLPFSLQFFMISIMFIIFDIEISLLIPMIMPIHSTSPKKLTLTVLIFLLIMWMGLIYEWHQSSMKWKI